MKNYIRYCAAFLLIIAQQLHAQNVEFRAEGPGVVEVGEQFEIAYSLSSKPQKFTPPEFKGFSFLGGPSTSSSTSVSVVNGRMTQQTTVSYSYYFVANTPGKYALDAATAVVDNKQYSSNPLTIEVVGGAAAKQAQPQQGQTPQAGQAQEQVDNVANDDVFVRINVNKNSVYQGEHIIATVKIYSKLNISALEDIKFPEFNGFFRQDIETPALKNLEKENVNGQIYYSGVLQRMILFPQKSGELTISPMHLKCIVQQVVKNNRRQRSVFDDFWGPQVQEVRKELSSKAIKIAVKSLPGNTPDSFTGAVGNYTFKANIDKTKVKTNDAITLKITISGNGNLKIIEPFKINFPADFETYDPKTSVNVQNSTAGSSGSKTFEYLIIPRHSGDFKIAPVEFTFFDVQNKKFKTLASDEFIINVEKGADEAGQTVTTIVDKNEIKLLGKDIQYIKSNVSIWKTKNSFLFDSLEFWLYYIISIIVFSIIVLIRRKQIKDNSNVALVRKRKAAQKVRKRLKEAEQNLKTNNVEKFYENILSALWGYLSDKLNIPMSNLSRDTIKETFEKRSIDIQLLDRINEIADICEYARYAPSAYSSQLDDVYNKVDSLMSDIEQKVK